MATDFLDGDYLGAYRRFFEHFVANTCTEDQLPVKTDKRDVQMYEISGKVASIVLQYINQR